MKTITIAIATIFQNAGDATRAIEIAKIIKASQPKNYNLRIIFISRGSKFEQQVIDCGFEIYHAKPEMMGIQYQKDFNSKFGELIGDRSLAIKILQGEIEAYQDIKPDVLIYGFWPIGSIAKRIAIPKVKSIAFLPIPLKDVFLKENHTFPDEVFLSRLPKCLQKVLFKSIPFFLLKRNPALRHSLIRKAAEEMGWDGNPLINIFEMLKSDLYLINDIPEFYQTEMYGSDCIFTGAIFSYNKEEEITDAQINSILSSSNPRKKIFCSLGSSGRKEQLFEIIKIFNNKKGLEYSGVILSPPAVCDIHEARTLLKNTNVYITSTFVPAKTITEKADLVICHGGQGTLQTAITSGVPIIGVPTQPEQKINLEHLEKFGGAIKIPAWNWKSKNIAKKVEWIFAHYSAYKQKATHLKNIYEKKQADKVIAEKVWEMITLSDIV